MSEFTIGIGALDGLRVLDLTRVLSGPFATKWLATMGADVIKIENPKDPDITRSYQPEVNGHSAYFPTVNHNKRCITLNLKSEEGKEIFRKLAKESDVVIENYRPGVMDRLGLGYDVLSEINPGIIYASISGYGTYGPYKDRPGYDVTAQGISGIMHLTGYPDGAPMRIGSSFGDTVTGMSIVIGILSALYCRNCTGQGQKVEAALVDSLISLSCQDYIRYFAAGEVPMRMGNIYKTWTPYGTYKASDGYYIIGCGTDKHFALLAQAMEMPELAENPDYKTQSDRVAHREALDAIIDAWAANKTVTDICDLLVSIGVPCGPINSIVEVSQDAHIAGAREMFPTLQQDGIGELKVTNIPVRFSKSALVPLQSAAKLGGDNEDVFAEIGITKQELEVLKNNGVI